MDDVHRNDAPVWGVHVVVYAVGGSRMKVEEKMLLILRSELKSRNITQKELANELGITEVHMCRLLKGKRHITLGTLYKIAKGLHLSIDALLGLGEKE